MLVRRLTDLVDSTGRTALTFGAQSGRWDLCEALLASRADINARDARGNTALMWAIMMGHQDLALELMQQNADIAVKNAANKNALYLAAFTPEITRALLKRHAKIEEVKAEGGDFHGAALVPCFN